MQKSISKHKQNGFTLVEILIAMILFLIAFSAIALSLRTSIFKTSYSSDLTTGINFAQKEIELFMMNTNIALPMNVTQVSTKPGISYTVSWQKILTLGNAGNVTVFNLYNCTVTVNPKGDYITFTVGKTVKN